MSTALRTSLENARRIIVCAQHLLTAGMTERCKQCEVERCRRQMARYIPQPAESGRSG